MSEISAYLEAIKERYALASDYALGRKAGDRPTGCQFDPSRTQDSEAGNLHQDRQAAG